MEEANIKQVLLNKGLSLFIKKGFDSVGIQEICDSCQTSKPTLYYYFKSKVGLLDSIVDFYGSRQLELLSKASEYHHDFIKHLTNLLKAQISFALENPDFFYLSCNTAFSPEENPAFKSFRELQKKIDLLYLDLFEKCSNEFGNMRGLEKLYSKSFQSLIISTCNSILQKNLELNESNIYKVIHSFVYGVAN